MREEREGGWTLGEEREGGWTLGDRGVDDSNNSRGHGGWGHESRGDRDGGRGAADFAGRGLPDFGGQGGRGGGRGGRGPGHFSDRPSCPDSVLPRLTGKLFDDHDPFDDDGRAAWLGRRPRGEGLGGGRGGRGGVRGRKGPGYFGNGSPVPTASC